MTEDAKIKATEPTAPAATVRSRRRALAKLGLAAGMAYITPTLLHLDRNAQARFSTGGGKMGKKKRWKWKAKTTRRGLRGKR